MKRGVQLFCVLALAVVMTACAGNRPAPVEYKLPPQPWPSDAPPVPEVEDPQPEPEVTPTPDLPTPKAPLIDNPREILVKRGETLFDIAEEYRVPVRAIIEINQLTPPYDVKTGQRLLLPQPLVYEVVRGDTLYGIARRFNIDALGSLNSLKRPYKIYVGQKLALPSVARDNGPGPQASGQQPDGLRLSTPSPAPEVKTAKPATKPDTTEDSTPTKSLPKTLTVVPGKGLFQYPVQGKLISSFGPKGPGQRNDGINIAAPAGTPVKAAAGGTVAYAGSEIASFGNLVLIRHKGEWVTAYAHLSKYVVKEGQTVKQGQTVGYVGQSGNVNSPQLHFETRHNARPVDPAPLLP